MSYLVIYTLNEWRIIIYWIYTDGTKILGELKQNMFKSQQFTSDTVNTYVLPSRNTIYGSGGKFTLSLIWISEREKGMRRR